ncbi:MAG: TIM barrel protein [Alistipes sp.]|nr:TIM barrel protein [Alistipes sp.]
MDRLGFFKHGLSALMDAATTVVGMKKAVESMAEAVDEALSNIKTDMCLHLPSLDAKMYEDAKNTLVELAQMGYTTLEVGGYFGDTIHDQKVDVFNEMARSAGLKVVAAHLNREYKAEEVEKTEENDDVQCKPLNNDEEVVSEIPKFPAEHKWWTEALDAVKTLGCKSVTMAKVPAFAPQDAKLMAETYAAYFERIADMAQERDMKFCYHPSAAELKADDGESFFDLIAQKCNPEKVFFQIDTFDALEAEVDIFTLLKHYKGRVLSLHLHDRGVVCDSGDIDFDKVVKCGYDCGVQNVIIEQRYFTLPPMNCIERSLQNVTMLSSVRL